MMNLLRNKYIALPIAIKASIWFLICNIIQKAIALLTVPIITRMLSTTDYGIYSIFTSWGNIIIIIATLQLNGGGYYVGMKKYYDDKAQYTSSIGGLMLLCTTLVLAFFLGFNKLISPITGLSILYTLLMFAWIYSQGGVNLWFTESRYEYKYHLIVYCTFFTAISTPVLKIVLILFAGNSGGDKALAAILGYIVPVAIVGIVAWSSILSKGKTLFIKEYWKFAISFNVPLIAYYLSQQVLNQADRVMIGQFDSAGSAGIYSVAYQLASAIAIINSAISSSLDPWQFQAMIKGEFHKASKVLTLVLSGVTAIHMLVIIVAPEVMRVFAAPEYFDAIYVIPPVTIGILFTFYNMAFINTEFFFEKNKILSFSSIIAAILNIVLNWIAIPIFGYLAAGYTTAICFLANLAFHGFVANHLTKRMESGRPYNNKVIIVGTCISIALMFTITALYPYPLIRYIIIAICIVLALIFKKRLINTTKYLMEEIRNTKKGDC